MVGPFRRQPKKVLNLQIFTGSVPTRSILKRRSKGSPGGRERLCVDESLSLTYSRSPGDTPVLSNVVSTTTGPDRLFHDPRRRTTPFRGVTGGFLEGRVDRSLLLLPTTSPHQRGQSSSEEENCFSSSQLDKANQCLEMMTEEILFYITPPKPQCI